MNHKLYHEKDLLGAKFVTNNLHPDTLKTDIVEANQIMNGNFENTILEYCGVPELGLVDRFNFNRYTLGILTYFGFAGIYQTGAYLLGWDTPIPQNVFLNKVTHPTMISRMI